jgi:GNAT superfamily N-acetyltransferase
VVAGAWRIGFVAPAEYRGQGVAKQLLAGGIDYARRRGATVIEAYPVDKPGHCADQTLWFGTKSMFDAAGFKEVARRKPARPVVRLNLRAAARSSHRSGSIRT